MKLTLDNLKQAGGFVDRQAHEKEIEWRHQGEEYKATVFVLPLSYVNARNDIVAARAGRDGMALRIATCIVDEAGEPVFSYEDVTGEADPERGPLSEGLTMALLEVIGEVSGLGKRRPRSQKSRKSGTSS